MTPYDDASSRVPADLFEDFSDIGEEIDPFGIEGREPLGQGLYLILHEFGLIDKDLKGAVDLAKSSPYGELLFSQSLIDDLNAEPHCKILKMRQNFPGLHIDQPRAEICCRYVLDGPRLSCHDYRFGKVPSIDQIGLIGVTGRALCRLGPRLMLRLLKQGLDHLRLDPSAASKGAQHL